MALAPSHLHWDHASGSKDFPGTPALVQRDELAFARRSLPPALLPSQAQKALAKFPDETRWQSRLTWVPTRRYVRWRSPPGLG